MSNTLKNKEFIIKAKLKHGNKYDYSLAKYKNCDTKIKIICPIHGEFEQTPYVHLHVNGCINCNKELKGEKDNFIKKAKEKHGDKYDYSLVVYKNCRTKIKIICPIHGIFNQTPTGHLSNSGCLKCSIKLKAIDINDFNINASKIHNNKYDYSLVNYVNKKTKVKIICPIHGIFTQTPTIHLNGGGCKKCKKTISTGEKFLHSFLKKFDIEYVTEYGFSSCKNINILSFDVFLLEFNLCMEFHGFQHFESYDFFGGEKNFAQRLKRDKIKEKFCKENDIPLIIVFRKKYKSTKFCFVDLYKNSAKHVINSLKLENLEEYTIGEYLEFKKQFLFKANKNN